MGRSARHREHLRHHLARHPRIGRRLPGNFRLLASWGATRTTLVAYVIPVVGIVLGYLVLAEPVDGRLILGTLFVVAGVALVNSPYGRRRSSVGCAPAEPKPAEASSG